MQERTRDIVNAVVWSLIILVSLTGLGIMAIVGA